MLTVRCKETKRHTLWRCARPLVICLQNKPNHQDYPCSLWFRLKPGFESTDLDYQFFRMSLTLTVGPLLRWVAWVLHPSQTQNRRQITKYTTSAARFSHCLYRPVYSPGLAGRLLVLTAFSRSPDLYSVSTGFKDVILQA